MTLRTRSRQSAAAHHDEKIIAADVSDEIEPRRKDGLQQPSEVQDHLVALRIAVNVVVGLE